MAAVVDDGDLIGRKTLHRVGDEMSDGVDLIRFETASAHIDEDGRGGLHSLLGEQQPVFGLNNHHPRGADAVQLHDGASKFALHRAKIVGALDKVGKAKLPLVENLEAHAIAARQTFGCEIHAELVDLVGRHLNRRAASADDVRDVLRLEMADDGRGILFAQAGIQQLVVGTARP